MAAQKPTKPAAAAGTETETEQPLIKVTLVKPHTHKRQHLQPGATLQVTAEQKAWLESQGIVGELAKAEPDE